MALSFVDTYISQSYGVSQSVALSALAAGEVLVAMGAFFNDGNSSVDYSTGACSDDNSNTWVAGPKAHGLYATGRCYVCLATKANSGSTTVTVANPLGTNKDGVIHILRYAGAASYVLDAASIAAFTTDTLFSDPSGGAGIVTSVANSLIVVVGACASGQVAWSNGSGYTLRGNDPSGIHMASGSEDQAGITMGTYATSIGGTNLVHTFSAAVVIAPSGGGSGLSMRRRRESGMFQRRDDNWEKKSGLWQMNKRLAA